MWMTLREEFSADSLTYRHAAGYVEKILKGAAPTDLPVEQAQKHEFALNLKSASAFGLTVSRSLLLRATRVIRLTRGRLLLGPTPAG